MGLAVFQGLSRMRMWRGGDHVRIRVVRFFERQVAEPVGGRAGQVDLHGHGFAVDEPSQAAQLVEHLFHDRQQFRRIVGF